LPGIGTPLWVLTIGAGGLAAFLCLRGAVPLIFGDEEDYPFLARLDWHLPLKGRWLRALLGSFLLFLGIALALVTAVMGTMWLGASLARTTPGTVLP
jgi:hypothetical protein